MPNLTFNKRSMHGIRTWRADLEIETGRAWMRNAVRRDLIPALVMVEMSHLLFAVPQAYRYKSSGRATVSRRLSEHRVGGPSMQYGTSAIRQARSAECHRATDRRSVVTIAPV